VVRQSSSTASGRAIGGIRLSRNPRKELAKRVDILDVRAVDKSSAHERRNPPNAQPHPVTRNTKAACRVRAGSRSAPDAAAPAFIGPFDLPSKNGEIGKKCCGYRLQRQRNGASFAPYRLGTRNRGSRLHRAGAQAAHHRGAPSCDLLHVAVHRAVAALGHQRASRHASRPEGAAPAPIKHGRDLG